MRFTNSRTLVGKKIYHIARDMFGVVRLQADTLEKLEKKIEDYNKREKSGEIKIEIPDGFVGTVPTENEEEKKKPDEEDKVQEVEESSPKGKEVPSKKRKIFQTAKNQKGKDSQRKFFGYRRR